MMIKSRRIIRAEHLARIGAVRNSYVIYIGKPKERYCFGAVGIGGRILLKWILMKYCIGWIQLDHDRVQWQAPLNMAMNHRVQFKCRECLEQLSDYQLLTNSTHEIVWLVSYLVCLLV
jgi:hypothetical protein